MLSRIVIAVAAITVAASQPALSQDAGSTSADSLILWHEARAIFPTRVLLPSDFNPDGRNTLVLALHGYGSTAENFLSLAPEFLKKGVVFAAPEAAYAVLNENGEIGYDWWLYQMPENKAMHFRAASPLVRDHLPNVINDLVERYSIEDVYLLGFSQGALTSLMAGVVNSNAVDGIIAFGGLADQSWYPGSVLDDARHVRVLIVHGEDDTIVAYSEGVRTRDLFQEHGFDVTFRSFEGGHIVPDEQLKFAAEWIVDED